MRSSLLVSLANLPPIHAISPHRDEERPNLSGFTNDLKSTARHCASKSSRPGGGAGVRACVRVFLYYHHTPHNFFRHKLPQRDVVGGVVYILMRFFVSVFLCFCVAHSDRSSISVASCSLLEVFVGVVRP
jgi:hypothetical protein